MKKSHLGIYAVIEKGNRLLLIKKARGPYKGKWDLPGGSPIFGESIFQTLQREVKEETGIVIVEAVPYGNHAFQFDYQDGENLIAFHHTCLIYQAFQFDETQYSENINAEDVNGCAWIDKSLLTPANMSKLVACVL